MPKRKIKSLKFKGKIRGGSGIEFLSVEIPANRRLLFALVRYALDSQPQHLGLRLDMDKGVFIDRFENEAKDKVFQEAASEICDFLADILKT